MPVALTCRFHSVEAKQAQWIAYIRKARVLGDVPTLDVVAVHIAEFVMPVVQALVASKEINSRWPPSGPWR